MFGRLARARPRDINLRMAVLDRSGYASFQEHPADPQLSSVVTTEAKSDAPGAPKRVPCDTLANILAAHAPGRPIEFLKIDAEGSEAAIVSATDWRAVRPTVLLIEATYPGTDELANAAWEPVLLGHGYRRAYFDGVNCFYVPDERTDLLRHFRTPVNVHDRFTLYDPLSRRLLGPLLPLLRTVRRTVRRAARLAERVGTRPG